VHDLFARANERQPREHRLDQHPLPRATRTEFEVGGIAFRGMQGRITQDNHRFFNLANEPWKGVIRNIGRGPVPPHTQPPLMQEETPCPADHPAMVRHACAADLLGTAAFAARLDQLAAVGVNAPKPGRSGQEDLRPVLMGLQKTQEPGALGAAGKQRPLVARQPAIQGPVPPTFEGMQQAHGDALPGPEVGFGGCGDGAQLVG